MKSVFYYIKQLHFVSGTKLYLNMIGMVISSLLEGLGILMLIPMLTISGILSMGQTPLSDYGIFDELRQLPQSASLSLILGVYLLIVVGQNWIQRSIMIRNVRIQQQYSQKLRIDTYHGLLRAEWAYFLTKRTSDLINLLTIELARVVSGVRQLLQFITALLFTLIQVGIALWLSPPMTLFVLCCGGLLGFVSRGYIRRSKKLGSQTSQHAQDYLAGITDQLNGIKDIKSNNLEKSRLNWLQGLSQNMMDEQLSYIRLTTSSQLLYKLASGVLIAVLVFASIQLFHAQGEYLLLIIVIFARLWPRFTTLQSNLEQIASTIPAFNQLQQLRQECKQAIEQGIWRQEDANLQPLKMRQGLICNNISFKYQSAESKYALKGINLHIPAGRMTAIIGPSGAGKSTLIDLLMGLIRPESGHLLIDGEQVGAHNLLAYRRSIGYVAQDPFLYHASIRENLMMIKPDATDEELWEALEFASSAEFVRNLPQGLDTVIGDRGIRLSGGERQRLVLARAIIRKPSILVLDEATSALDTENEKKIQEALDRLKGTMTIIVVAHRLSTIRHADQILVMEDGRVTERGAYHELAFVKTSS